MTGAISRPLAGWMEPRFLPLRLRRTRAYTALFGVSTQDFFNFIKGDPSLLAGIPTLSRVAAWGGGFPIKVNGEVVGAIGKPSTPCRHARKSGNAGDRKSTRLNSSHVRISYAV